MYVTKVKTKNNFEFCCFVVVLFFFVFQASKHYCIERIKMTFKIVVEIYYLTKNGESSRPTYRNRHAY